MKCLFRLVTYTIFVSCLVGYVCYLYDINAYFWNDTTEIKNEITEFAIVNVTTNTWQRVVDTNDLFVYSAYMEENFSDRIRIIGIARSVETRALYCYTWYENGSLSGPKKADVVYINEGHFKRLTAVYIVCYLESLKRPVSVAVVADTSIQMPQNILEVRLQKSTTLPYTITACLSPLYVKSTDIHFEAKLLEWIEMNIVLGVELFTVYVSHVNSSISRILNYYEKLGKMEILNWVFPSSKANADIFKDIHYNGQLTALNDCLYRNKGRSLYTMMIDIDEIIIPQRPDNLRLNDILRLVPDKSVYIFRHSYVKLGKDTDSKNQTHLSYLNKIFRDNNIKQETDRSKMLVKPDQVITVGIHNPWAIRYPGEKYVVDPELAVLYHYRSNLNEAKDITWIETTSTMKYIDIVRHNMNKALSSISRLSNSTE